MTSLSSTSIFSPEILHKFDIHEFRHASAILKNDFPEELKQLSDLLQQFQITHEDIITPGGRKSPIATKFDNVLYGNGWKEKKWDVDVVIDGTSNPSPTHNVDYYKNKIAVELEWNNKDPFFDRDLNNFRLLHQIGVVSVGIIVTRADELQELFNELGKGSSYGASTTHLGKLMPKIIGGGAAECPLLVLAITKNACVKEVKEQIEEAAGEN
ncbi:MAG TPA: BglII/BstYI family type II restriction endonuclease [Patescibacteria group bacterium]|nr:BglII/BstYI family type II restriction endonuclease [Patescibacteria group bacterium]